MAQNAKTGGPAPDKHAEARNLAHEAAEELKHGDKAEGKFLADEAKALDPSGAAEGLRQGGTAKPKSGG